MRVVPGDVPGQFEMILATEGEASDGHILNIEGGDIPQRMPLLDSHQSTLDATLGSVVSPRKDLNSTPRSIRATGQIEMDGTGTLADERRDLDLKIRNGHIGAVSVRWDDVESTARVDLPKGHPHRVGRNDDGPSRFGRYFDKWRALEGSVVVLPADTDALIEHANACEGEQRAFWRSMADQTSEESEAVEVVEEYKPVIDDVLLAAVGDVLVELRRLHDRYDEIEHALEHRASFQPEADAQPDEVRTDQSASEVADQRPPITGLTLEKLLPVLRESRRLQAADNARLLNQTLAIARGRVGK